MLTDLAITDCLESNVNELPAEYRNKCDLLAYNWAETEVPSVLLGKNWDCIICSDILYEEKSHDLLLGLLKKLTFKKLFLSYKRRNDEAELHFFENLELLFSVTEIDPATFPRINLCDEVIAAGLHLLVVTMK